MDLWVVVRCVDLMDLVEEVDLSFSLLQLGFATDVV